MESKKLQITKKKTKTAPKQGIIPLNIGVIPEPIITEEPSEPVLNMDVSNLIPDIQAIIKEPIKKSVIIKKRKQPIKEIISIETIKEQPIKKKFVIKKRKQPITEIQKTTDKSLFLIDLKSKLEKLKKTPDRKVKTIYNPFLDKNVKKNKRNIDSILNRINTPIEASQEHFLELANKDKENQVNDYIEDLTNLRNGGEIQYDNIEKTDLPALVEAIDRVFSNNTFLKIIIKPKKSNPIYYTWSNRSKNNFLGSIQEALTRTISTGVFWSGLTYDIFQEEIEYLKIVVPNQEQRIKKRKGGAFFEYYNLTNIDLSRYGIYKETDEPDYDENCLLYSLRLLGMNEIKLNQLKLKFTNREIPQCKLKEICIELNIQINLKSLTTNRTKLQFGNTTEQYNLGLLENHYFINENIDISNYSIENYETLKDLEKFTNIIAKKKRGYERKKVINNTSFSIITKLLDNKENLLKPVKKTYEMMETPYFNKLELSMILEYDEEKCCKLTNKNQDIDNDEHEELNEGENEENNRTILYDDWKIDLETPPDKNKIYKPIIIVGNNSITKKRRIYVGKDCIRNFLNGLEKDSRLLAHNMGGFDGTFFIQHLFQIKECNRGNNTISTKGKYYNPITKKTINIFLKDSYPLIHAPLKDFPKMFFTKKERLTIRKEVLPYELMNYERLIENNGLESIEEAYKYIPDKKIKQFNKNLDDWKLRRMNGKFDFLKYIEEYCKIDVDILEKGYEIFRKDVKKALNIDINDVLTIAGLADKYLIEQGCYNDVYMLSGVPNQFIQNCVVGGRTMTRANKKFIYKGLMVPLDANSLYPSAITKIGFLKGKPKIIYDKNYEKLSKYDGYYIRIRVKNIGTKLDFPLLSVIDKKTGVRHFTNDLVDEIIYIDKTSLEDAIKYQKLEFEILDGYYFNESFNETNIPVINSLYNKRKEYKKLENPLELVYKEILNCSYGKNILKAIEYKYLYKDNEQTFNKYFNYNYNYIVKAEEIDGYFKKYRIKVINPINTHFSRPHIGVQILSMSKRIMNNVICLGEELDLNIAYQDTDSIYLQKDHIKPLEEAYIKIYNKNLVGDELGEFKPDFKLKYGDADEYGDYKTSRNVWSDYSIFLGKKAYFNKLQGLTPEGKEIQGIKTTLKGVSPESIKMYCNLNNVDECSIFEELLNGNTKKFDLLCRDINGVINSCKMKRNDNKTIKKIDEEGFYRDVSFSSEKAEYKNDKFIGGYRE
jgi:hypothetical protein